MVARELRSRARLNGGGAAEPPSQARAAGASPARRAAAAAERRQRAERAAERAREVQDSPRVLRDKCRRLARALRNAKHLVVSLFPNNIYIVTLTCKTDDSNLHHELEFSID